MSTRNSGSGHSDTQGRARRARISWLSVAVVLVASVWYVYRRRVGAEEAGAAMYIISGSFSTSSLYVLRYEPASRKLHLVQSVPAYGPHQYLHLDRRRRRLYATSWQQPARLSAWDIHFDGPGMPPQLTLINHAPITAVSSYISSKYSLLFSVGGPTGELHQLNPHTGAIQEKLQELLFVPKEALQHEDKSRNALRYGSHAIEVSSLDQVFVPHLGRNSIWMYQLDAHKKALKFLSEVMSVRADDGPRHAVVSADGRRLYVVTEHTSRVDLYDVTGGGLKHRASRSVIEEGSEPGQYRGDTIRMVPWDGGEREYMVATTRGATPSQRGHLAVLEYHLASRSLSILLRWQTPTSGGKANAIELCPLSLTNNHSFLLLLTDDQLGSVSVLQCDLASRTISLLDRALIDHQHVGASHAVWL